ncbi:MAG: UDP-N-acetylmuramate--L-alanine ligase [Deltaproteobacteria bacterium]|nr:UDP-N-acetylmuramate--L-alanine ligase [Deltaproteobacteria bacterium]OQY16379.1 MAG: UDP-N-acetylmuramate--L-alanine ligase [Desulfobacterium sp. 4572_20]HDH87143.1 UDP-N-acetylmuramate--L-alanine ligase [Desulfobacteraceae bacterium]MBW2105169.1 UDP-N-acetylmuramate--L-alanine ligase [Deltaproteobacteria bacterium]MBW2332734.1 UDP-N-acetylmuramate--L-alanine ligase [Deltaproteobacteria bacterium]
MFGKTKHIHLVGIGGIGMSGIAELLLNLDYFISGSDLRKTEVTEHLSDLGGKIFLGHRPQNIDGADVVVFSSAIKGDNPEIVEAREKSIPVIPRAEMLAELMRLKYGIAVAGSHGKTTTTSMIGSILTMGGFDPTVVIGGRLNIWGGSNARLGRSDFLVAEADESDGSFLALSPSIAVISNIDHEHIDFYHSMNNLRKTFIDFINKIPFYGRAILCVDDKEVHGLIPELTKSYLTYGLNSQADIRASGISKEGLNTTFDVIFKGRLAGNVTISIPGKHNILNALAAVGVGLELDIDFKYIREGLKDLGGLKRRFEIKDERDGILFLDDYGHHPTEIMATLSAAKECWPDRRLVVVFQPHRFTRTKDLYDKFVISFNQADFLIITPIYGAGEEPIEGVDSKTLYQGIRNHGHRAVTYCDSAEDAISELLDTIRPGDIVLTLGAGDIHLVGTEVLRRF